MASEQITSVRTSSSEEFQGDVRKHPGCEVAMTPDVRAGPWKRLERDPFDTGLVLCQCDTNQCQPTLKWLVAYHDQSHPLPPSGTLKGKQAHFLTLTPRKWNKNTINSKQPHSLTSNPPPQKKKKKTNTNDPVWVEAASSGPSGRRTPGLLRGSSGHSCRGGLSSRRRPHLGAERLPS